MKTQRGWPHLHPEVSSCRWCAGFPAQRMGIGASGVRERGVPGPWAWWGVVGSVECGVVLYAVVWCILIGTARRGVARRGRVRDETGEEEEAPHRICWPPALRRVPLPAKRAAPGRGVAALEEVERQSGAGGDSEEGYSKALGAVRRGGGGRERCWWDGVYPTLLTRAVLSPGGRKGRAWHHGAGWRLRREGGRRRLSACTRAVS
jgi:hypothetical protein